MSNVLDNFAMDYIKLNPTLNDIFNLESFKHLNHLLPNIYSDDYSNSNIDLYKKYLKKLNGNKNLSDDELSLKYNIQMKLEYYDYNFDLIPINHLQNIYYEYYEMATGNYIYNFNKIKDYNDFINRLKSFDEITNSIIHKFTEGIKKKYTLPENSVKLLIEQMENMIKKDGYKNKNIKYKLNYDFNEKVYIYLIKNIEKVLNFIKKEYISKSRKTIGHIHLPNGKKEYEYIVKENLTLQKVNIQSIYNYGIEEINRIRNEMKKILISEKFKGTLEDYYFYLHSLKEQSFKNENEILKYYNNLQKKIIKELLDKQFTNNIGKKAICNIKKVPEFNQKFASEAYYISGDLSGKRDGVFYLNTFNLKNQKKYNALSLFLHEAIPGHHFHITSINLNNKIPLYKKISNNNAYYEGWGTYCENLYNYELNADYFGKLALELLRSIRLVIDTGIHYYKWDFKQSKQFFEKAYFKNQKAEILNELERYIIDPGQALSYKMGEKMLIDIKNKFKSTKQFHNFIVDKGPFPFFLIKNDI